MKLRAKVLVTALILCFCTGNASATDELPRPLRYFLGKYIRLTQPEMQSVIAGRPVAKLLETDTKDEVAIFGIVRIDVPEEFFIEKFRNIVEFESGSGVEAAGRFHTPPLLSDVVTLSVDEKDLKEIQKCKSGNCGVKLSDRVMQRLQSEINWRSPDAASQAQSVIRQAFVDYVASYQKMGDDALTVYNDKEKPQSLREGLYKLMQNSSALYEYDAELASYLKKYPQEKPPDTEDIFYWQKGEFGLKPVIRASHVVIHRRQGHKNISYTIASKMLFASHYFRAALELKSIVPTTADNAKSFYLVCLNRSFVDGLTGFKGTFIRGSIKRKSRDSLARYLTNIKQKQESKYQQSAVNKSNNMNPNNFR